MTDDDHTLHTFFTDHGVEISYAPGEIILRAGDTPSGVYLLVSGAVKLFYYNQAGEINIHTVYKPGEIFPIAWAMKHVLFASNFEAMTNVVMLRAPLDLFEKHSTTDVAFSASLAQQITDQFITFVYRVGNLQYSNSYDRIVFQLLFMASRFGTIDGDSCIIQIPITHNTIANTVNVARETASRCMKRLISRDIIEQSGKTLIIKSLSKLSQEIKGGEISIATFKG